MIVDEVLAAVVVWGRHPQRYFADNLYGMGGSARGGSASTSLVSARARLWAPTLWLTMVLAPVTAWAQAPAPSPQGSELRAAMATSPAGLAVQKCLRQAAPKLDRGEVLIAPLLSPAIGSLRGDGDDLSLNEASRATLRELMQSWRPHSGPARVRLMGLTDGSQTAGYAMALSLRTAQSVAQALQEQGVPPEQIETLGLGHFATFAKQPGAQVKGTRALVAIVLAGTRNQVADGPEPAQDPAVALVRSLYERFSFEASPLELPLVGFESTPASALQPYLDRPLLKGLERDRTCASRKRVPCEIDEKLLWGSQDPQVCSLAIGKDGDQVTVRQFDASGSSQVIRFRLRSTYAGLRITDIIADTGSLKSRLSRAYP